MSLPIRPTAHAFESAVPDPPEVVCEWHQPSGAFARLLPPWQPARTLQEADDLAEGTAVLGFPAGRRWVARHVVLRHSRTGDRIVMVASGGMYTQRLAVDDPEYREGRYRGATAYSRPKRMQAESAPVPNSRWDADRISMYVLHRGWADTPGVTDSIGIDR